MLKLLQRFQFQGVTSCMRRNTKTIGRSKRDQQSLSMYSSQTELHFETVYHIGSGNASVSGVWTERGSIWVSKLSSLIILYQPLSTFRTIALGSEDDQPTNCNPRLVPSFSNGFWIHSHSRDSNEIPVRNRSCPLGNSSTIYIYMAYSRVQHQFVQPISICNVAALFRRASDRLIGLWDSSG